jgi:hypothetical protein
MEIVNDLGTFRFWRHFLIKAFAIAGGMSGLIQFNNTVFPERLWTGNWVIWAVSIMSTVISVVLSWPRPITAEFSAPKTRITVVKGDLLQESGHLIIGASDTFDTEMPNIIARNSVQGQVLDKLYGGNIALLNQHLDAALIGKNVIGSINKPGKSEKYDIGTVAVVVQGPRKLFFSAYSEMNEFNEARATADTVWKSLQALWSSVSVHANGTTISIPVIGGGQARLSNILPAQDAIRFIALSFMMASRRERICEELRIVVHENDYKKLDRLEIQSFISSLRPS